MNGDPVTPLSEDTKLQALIQRRDALQKQIWAAELKERAENAKPLVGKCFRYRNSYSCPKDESERWWLYRRVLSISASGRLLVFQFETDKDGALRIEPATRVIGHESMGEPITLRQYQHAWKVMVASLNRKAREAGAIK